MQQLSKYSIIAARFLVAIIFLLSAIGVIDQAEVARLLVERGTPPNLAPYLVVVARSVQLIGGLALIFGFFQRAAALALIGFLIPATLVGHAFWLAAGTPAYEGQLINFLKNLAIGGGLLFIAASSSQTVRARFKKQ